MIISCTAQRPGEHLAVAIAALAVKKERGMEKVQLQHDATSSYSEVIVLDLKKK